MCAKLRAFLTLKRIDELTLRRIDELALKRIDELILQITKDRCTVHLHFSAAQHRQDPEQLVAWLSAAGRMQPELLKQAGERCPAGLKVPGPLYPTPVSGYLTLGLVSSIYTIRCPTKRGGSRGLGTCLPANRCTRHPKTLDILKPPFAEGP